MITSPEGVAVRQQVRRTTRGTFEAGYIDYVSTQANGNDAVGVPLAPYVCAQVQIDNNTGVTIQYSRVTQKNQNWRNINSNITMAIEGIVRASDISIRRADYNGSQPSVTVVYEVYV